MRFRIPGATATTVPSESAQRSGKGEIAPRVRDCGNSHGPHELNALEMMGLLSGCFNDLTRGAVSYDSESWLDAML